MPECEIDSERREARARARINDTNVDSRSRPGISAASFADCRRIYKPKETSPSRPSAATLFFSRRRKPEQHTSAIEFSAPPFKTDLTDLHDSV